MMTNIAAPRRLAVTVELFRKRRSKSKHASMMQGHIGWWRNHLDKAVPYYWSEKDGEWLLVTPNPDSRKGVKGNLLQVNDEFHRGQKISQFKTAQECETGSD